MEQFFFHFRETCIFVFKIVQFSHMMMGFASKVGVSFQIFWFEFIISQNSFLFVSITVGQGIKQKVYNFVFYYEILIYSIVLMIIIIHILLQIHLLIFVNLFDSFYEVFIRNSMKSVLLLKITTVFNRAGSSAHYGRLKLNL